MGPVFFGIKLDATKCMPTSWFCCYFCWYFAGEFPKESNQRKARVARRVGRLFPAGLCVSLLVSMTKVSTGLFPQKHGCDQTDHPKKVIVEQLNHFRLLTANICMYPLYLLWDFGKKKYKPKPLGHWVQYIVTISWRAASLIPHPRCWPGADSWTPSKDSAVFFSMFAWETDHRMELSGGR